MQAWVQKCEAFMQILHLVSRPMDFGSLQYVNHFINCAIKMFGETQRTCQGAVVCGHSNWIETA